MDISLHVMFSLSCLYIYDDVWSKSFNLLSSVLHVWYNSSITSEKKQHFYAVITFFNSNHEHYTTKGK